MTRPPSATKERLPSFDEAEELGPKDRAFVQELVAVLEKHNNIDRFGLCLLHDHFSLTQDEILVETNDPKRRTLSVSVEKADGTDHIKASQWRFLPNVSGKSTAKYETEQYQVVLKCAIKCD